MFRMIGSSHVCLQSYIMVGLFDEPFYMKYTSERFPELRFETKS